MPFTGHPARSPTPPGINAAVLRRPAEAPRNDAAAVLESAGFGSQGTEDDRWMPVTLNVVTRPWFHG